MNLLSVTEKSSSGSPKPSNPNGRFCALCLGWLSPAVTGRALDIGAGRQEPVSRRIPAFSRFPLLWICSVTLSVFPHSSNASSLLYLCHCAGFSSLANPSISGWHQPHALHPVWSGARWAGKRARELSTWQSGPSHVGKTPSMHTHTHTHTRTVLY